MLQCPYCYTLNSNDSEFCNKCGSSIVESHDTLTSPLSQKVTEKGYIYFEPGDLFANRYRIIEEIGRGGMGIVYKAEDRVLNISVALKIIHPLFSSSPVMIQRFKEETLLARSISHENVIRIHDIGEDDDIQYISMDYIKGQNLRELIRVSGSLTTDRAVEITEQICVALKAAHDKNVIHRDLKPQNIMVDSSGVVYTMDFGLAKSMIRLETSKASKKIMGTPAYMAPEQARGAETDQRSDIYSLGIIMYEMLTGKRPFKADSKEGYIRKHLKEKPRSPVEHNALIQPYLSRIIMKCLEKNPVRRYQNAQEILDDLKSPLETPAPGPKTRARKILGYWYAIPIILIVGVLGYQEIRNRFDRTPEAPVLPEDSGRISVAILEFSNNTGDESLDHWRRALQNYLIFDLNQSKYFKIIPHDIILQIIQEQTHSGTEEYSSDLLNTISDQVGVDYFLLGSYAGIGEEFWITLNVRGAKESELHDSVMAEGQGLTSFPGMVDYLTHELKTVFMLSSDEIKGDIDQDIKVITTDSLEAWKLYTEANDLIIARRFEESIPCLESAIKLDTEFAMAHKTLSDVYRILRQGEKWKAHLLKALEYVHRVPEKERFLIMGDSAQYIEGSIPRAIENYEELLRNYPYDEKGNLSLGTLYRNMEEWDLALGCYERVLRSSNKPDRMFAVENISMIFVTKGLYDKALEIILPSQELFPNQAWYNRYVANIHLCKGDYDLALARARQAQEMEPQNPTNTILIGQLLTFQEEFDEALKMYALLVEKEEPELKAIGLYWTAHVQLIQGRYSLCLDSLEEGLRVAQVPDLLYERADLSWLKTHVCLRLDRMADADSASQILLDSARDTGDSLYLAYALMYRGIFQLGSSEIADAENTAARLEKAIAEGGIPKYKRYYHYLSGLILQSHGNHEDAVSEFEDALSLLYEQQYTYDNHAFYIDALAAAHLEENDYAAAQECYERIANLTAGRTTWGDIYARSFYMLGRIEEERQRGKEAVAQYRRFLKLWKEADPDLAIVIDARSRLAKLTENN